MLRNSAEMPAVLKNRMACDCDCRHAKTEQYLPGETIELRQGARVVERSGGK